MRLQPDTWVGQLAPSQFGRIFSASKEIRGVFSNQKKKKEIWGVTAKDLPVWFGIINNIALHFFFYYALQHQTKIIFGVDRN